MISVQDFSLFYPRGYLDSCTKDVLYNAQVIPVCAKNQSLYFYSGE